MGTDLLDTNLNQSEYYDDFDANNQYYRVLFKPSVAVQTRELNTIQSTLQHQIEKTGMNLFTSGTIVDGCNMTFNSQIGYVKINDTYANGSALTVSDFNNLFALSNTGLLAQVALTSPGYLSTSPNLNTLYVSYLNSATTNSAIKSFQNDEYLSIVTSANLVIGTIQVANTISSGNSNTTGQSYVMSVGSGTIFQKGILLQVAPQSLILDAYSNQPNAISVGFQCDESIVTSYQNQALLDNSQGAPNYAAPGADRLKIVPTLTIRASNSISSNTFFSIVDFVAGSPSIVNQDTSYAAIGQKMAQISYETNGNFVINPFNVRTLINYTANGSIDPYNVKLEIDSGLAYIQGYRIQVLGKLLGSLPVGNTVKNAPSQILTTQLGNYLQVDEFGGSFNPTILQQVSLRTAAAYAVSNNLTKGVPVNSIAAPGTEIGKANVIAVEYDNGVQGFNTCVYDLYLFNIQMNTGQSFSSVRSLYANSGGNLGFADVVLNSANTFSLQDSSLTPLVYSFNQAAIKTLETSSNTVDTQFEYVQSANVNFSNTGNVTVTIPSYAGGTNELPFGVGSLTTPQKEGFLIVAEANAVSVNVAGSVTVSGSNLTGVATTFTTSLYNGCYILIANGTQSEIKQISAITNNTVLTLDRVPTYSWSGANVAIQYLGGMEIPTSSSNVGISVGNTSSFTVTLNKNLLTSMNGTIVYPIQRTLASPAKKKMQDQVYVKINLSNAVNGTVGPWSLGIPDVFSVANVWYGSSYANTNPSITSQFTLHNGQTDYYYGLSYLTSNGASLSNTEYLLVELRAYLKDISSGAGFFSVDSYPIDDTGLSTNSIYTADIQTYTSLANSTTYNLRNSADFRFSAQNTIPYVANVTLAIANTFIVNPANTLTFNTSNLFIPVNGAEFESSLQYYVGRYDVVGLSTTGTIIINSGIPAENPIPAGSVQGGMTLATIYIPPYPTLTIDNSDPNASNGNPVSSLVYNTNRRYTMQDIGRIDQRVQQATYYSALSVLEQSAQNLMLTSQSGATVFQNGVLADPFNDFSISNTLDPEFNIAIDSANSQARPTFTQFLVNLNYSNALSNNISESINDRLLLLNNSSALYQQQPFASQVRNCSQDILYSWIGKVELTPEGQYMPDVTVNPAVVVDLDSYSNWVNLVDAWNTQFGTWNETTSTIITTPTSNTGGTSTTTQTTTTSSQLSASPVNTTYSFGDVVTDISLQPFCAAALVKFYATGLKPNTQVWTYFNDTPISTYCVQTDSNYNILTTGTMITDSLGQIYGYFYLPAQTFYAATINFQIMDISDPVTESNIITTIATCSYFGTNLAYTVNNLELQTTTAQLAITTISQTTSTTVNTASKSSIVTIVYNPSTQRGGGTSASDADTSSQCGVTGTSCPTGDGDGGDGDGGDGGGGGGY
jgi:hypothetical protein